MINVREHLHYGGVCENIFRRTNRFNVFVRHAARKIVVYKVDAVIEGRVSNLLLGQINDNLHGEVLKLADSKYTET